MDSACGWQRPGLPHGSAPLHVHTAQCPALCTLGTAAVPTAQWQPEPCHPVPHDLCPSSWAENTQDPWVPSFFTGFSGSQCSSHCQAFVNPSARLLVVTQSDQTHPVSHAGHADLTCPSEMKLPRLLQCCLRAWETGGSRQTSSPSYLF